MSDSDMLPLDEPLPAYPPPPSDAAEERIPVPNDGLGEWPTHGGPLGCLVSSMFGCVVAGFIGSNLTWFAHFNHPSSLGWAILGAVGVLIITLSFFGWVGWKVGKSVYREYAPSDRQLRYEERMRQEAQQP